MYAAAAVANMLKGVGKGLHEVDSISHKLHLTAKQTHKKKQCYCLKTSNNSQLDHQKPYSQQYNLAQIHIARDKK